MNFYEIDEAVFDTVPVYGTAGQAVNAAVPKTGATVNLRDAGTSTARTAYDAPSGLVLSSLTTVNGRIQGPSGQRVFVAGETPVDVVVNLGLPNQQTLTWSPPQLGPPGAAGPTGSTGGMVVAATVGDGTVNDTAAVLSALSALPAYSGGHGGGCVILPVTPTNVIKVDVNQINLGPGQRIMGSSMTGPMLRGNGAGNVVSATGDFSGIDHLFIQNQHADPLARALDVQPGVSNFAARRVFFNASAAGGFAVRVNQGYMAEFSHCRLAGAGMAACEAAMEATNGTNALRLIGTSLSDAKAGLVHLGGEGLYVGSECHFENFPSGGTYSAGIWASGVLGFEITGNYFELTPGYGIGFFGSTDWSSGGLIGGNVMQVPASINGFITLTFAENTLVAPNTLIPGIGTAPQPNSNGVVNTGSRANTNIVMPQKLTSGTGLEVVGGIIDRSGSGSPEGVVTANVGSRWWRTDGGTSTTLYVKTSGTGSSGWTAK